MPTIIEKLARFVSSLDYRKTPDKKALEHTVKVHLLDSLGVALYSSKLNYTRPLFSYALKNERFLGLSSILGTKSQRVDAAQAAFVNGSLIHGIDYDDTHPRSIVHASSFSVACALAVCEEIHSDSATLINSIIASMEIACRIGSVVPNILHLNGFHPTSTCGAFGAAAGASRALGLDEEATANAISIAASMTSGTTEGWTFGKGQESWSKRIQPGWAALAGIVSAQLAREGFRADRTMLEGKHGFYFSHAHGSKVRYELVTRGLGRSWETLEVQLKMHPCGYAMQAYIDCALKLREKLGEDDLEKIDSIVIRVPRSLKNLICEPVESKWKPSSGYSAKLTFPYPVATALIKGRLENEDFEDSAVRDKTIAKLARKVSYEFRKDSAPPSWPEHAYAQMSIRIGGKRIEESCYAKGTKENPAAFVDAEKKFISNTKEILSPEGQTNLIETVQKLDTLRDCSEICDVMRSSLLI